MRNKHKQNIAMTRLKQKPKLGENKRTQRNKNLRYRIQNLKTDNKEHSAWNMNETQGG